MRKEWETPKLIVLTRMKPEENVLTTCKASINSATPGYGFAGCDPSGWHFLSPS